MTNTAYDDPNWYKQSKWELKYVVPAAKKIEFTYNDLFIFENKNINCLRVKLNWEEIKEHYNSKNIPNTLTENPKVDEHGIREEKFINFCSKDKISRNKSLHGVVADGLLIPHKEYLRRARESRKLKFRNIIKKEVFTWHYKNKESFYERINDKRILFEVN